MQSLLVKLLSNQFTQINIIIFFVLSRLDWTEFSIEKIPDPLVHQSFAKDLILFVEEDEEQEDEGKKNCKEEGKEQDVKAIK